MRTYPSYFCFRVNPSSACTWRTVRINLFQTLYSSNTVETSLLWVSILFLFNFFYDAKWSLCQTCLSFILGPRSLSRYMGLFAMSFRVIQKPVRCHGLEFLSSFLRFQLSCRELKKLSLWGEVKFLYVCLTLFPVGSSS